ncbi:MAG: acetyl-CoA C-acetyltransferase [Gammaproteobacteria bacterium]|nr:acetyl-CoA C-acetyltransferase [Gammaproteobacteria bacterium]
MSEAYLVDAIRSPTGKRGGSLSNIHPLDLGAHVLRAIVARNPIPADEYDDVIFGVLDQVGPQGRNPARYCWLAAGLAESVPGTTIDRACGSSQQALQFAAQAVMSGTMDVVIAGGVQSMSRIPMGAASAAGAQYGFPDTCTGSIGFSARYGVEPLTQFRGARMMAERWGFTRRQMEEFALESHTRALRALAEGRFDREIVPLNGLERDETARLTSLEKMATLEPLSPGSPLTAAVSSQICDGSSAVLVVSAAALKRYGLTPRARIHHISVLADDPVMMLGAPIPATRRALKRCGMTISQIDLAECNEAFASVTMAWAHELEFPSDRLNVNGGAIALGHPLGATGTKLMTTLLHELERRKLRYGLETMCEGGGQANVTIIERL